MNNRLIEFIGWYGMTAVLAAYVLISLFSFSAASPVCLALNLTGAAGIATVAWRKKDYQPVVLNLIWALIALTIIISLLIGPSGRS